MGDPTNSAPLSLEDETVQNDVVNDAPVSEEPTPEQEQADLAESKELGEA